MRGLVLEEEGGNEGPEEANAANESSDESVAVYVVLDDPGVKVSLSDVELLLVFANCVIELGMDDSSFVVQVRYIRNLFQKRQGNRDDVNVNPDQQGDE
jgi:hypothetical protein